MENLRQSYARTKQLHHSYLFAGPFQQTKIAVLSFLKGVMQVEVEGNPDVISLHYPSLGIEDAREIKERSSQKPLQGKQFFIVSFSFATTEAQNALLKLFEEPNSGTHFFILTPSVGTVSSTLRSRVIQLSIPNTSESDSGATFLKASKGQRLSLLKKMIEDKNKESLVTLIASLEAHTQKKILQNHIDPAGFRSANALMYARKYLQSKSASVKMIGEYLAAVLPS